VGSQFVLAQAFGGIWSEAGRRPNPACSGTKNSASTRTGNGGFSGGTMERVKFMEGVDRRTSIRSDAKRKAPRAVRAFLDLAGPGKTIVEYRRGQRIYSQGDAASSVFYIQKGGVKLSVVNGTGKEAVVALLGPGDFFGEGCLAGVPFRMGEATAIVPTAALIIEKKEMIRVLHEEHKLSDQFIGYLLTRNIRVEEDLVDQLFNSIEKRLARALLLLARYGKQDQPQKMLPKISQETLAEMIGTTRSRVNMFMNKFRKLGFIHYNGRIEVHNSLLSVILHQ
jgi:CRP-like cAMP-binding protein